MTFVLPALTCMITAVTSRTSERAGWFIFIADVVNRLRSEGMPCIHLHWHLMGIDLTKEK